LRDFFFLQGGWTGGWLEFLIEEVKPDRWWWGSCCWGVGWRGKGETRKINEGVKKKLGREGLGGLGGFWCCIFFIRKINKGDYKVISKNKNTKY